MPTSCEVLKPFPLSEDGITNRHLEKGAVEAIPDELVAGLTKEGFVRPAKKAVKAAPENKAVETAPEDKAPANGEEA